MHGKRKRISLAMQGDDGYISDSVCEKRFRHFVDVGYPTMVRESRPMPVSEEDSPTLRSVIDYFVETYMPNKNAAIKTRAKYAPILEDFREYCASRNVARVSQLSRRIMDEWTAHISKSRKPKTVTSYITTVRACLNAAVEAEIITETPIRRYLFPTVDEPEINPLTYAQLRDVLAVVRAEAPDLYPVVAWIALTGNRPSDAIRLTENQIDTAARYVERKQTKVRRLARYPISTDANAVAVAEIARDDRTGALVFTDSRGLPWTESRIYTRFTRALRRARFARGVTIKDLRHTFASLMANDPAKPCPLPVLQILMCHTDIRTTMKYCRPMDATQYVDHFAGVVNEPLNKRAPFGHPVAPQKRHARK